MLLTGIGDVVHGLPLASDLKRRAPGVEVVWIAEPAPAEVVRGHPDVDHVVAYRKHAGLRGIAELRRDLAPLRCDLVINCMRYLKGAWPALLKRAKGIDCQQWKLWEVEGAAARAAAAIEETARRCRGRAAP